MRLIVSLAAATLLVTTAGGAFAASAVQKECSTKYQTAKSSGTLNGMTYNQFYSQCAKEAKEEKAAPTPAAAPVAPAPAAPTPAAAPAPAPAPAAPTTAAAGGAAVFPTAVSAQFSKMSAGKARMETCLAQYKANGSSKGAANGGLKWIEKGGGYYSECNKKLKS